MKRTILFALALGTLARAQAVSWASSGASPTVITGGGWAYAINHSGTVAGVSAATSSMTLGRSINSSGTAVGCVFSCTEQTGNNFEFINDSAHVVYDLNDLDSNGRVRHDAFFQAPPSSPVQLGNLGGVDTNGNAATWTTGVNNSDYSAGYSLAAGGRTHAFIRAPGGTITDLSTLQGSSGTSVATGINDSNFVVGFSSTASDGTHAVYWDGSQTIHDLGKGVSNGISPTGQIVGTSFTVSGDIGFSWTSAGGLVMLSTPSGRGSQGWGVNDLGEIVGFLE